MYRENIKEYPILCLSYLRISDVADVARRAWLVQCAIRVMLYLNYWVVHLFPPGLRFLGLRAWYVLPLRHIWRACVTIKRIRGFLVVVKVHHTFCSNCRYTSEFYFWIRADGVYCGCGNGRRGYGVVVAWLYIGVRFCCSLMNSVV